MNQIDLTGLDDKWQAPSKSNKSEHAVFLELVSSHHISRIGTLMLQTWFETGCSMFKLVIFYVAGQCLTKDSVRNQMQMVAKWLAEQRLTQNYFKFNNLS